MGKTCPSSACRKPGVCWVPWRSWVPWGAATKLGSPGSHGKAGPQGAKAKLHVKGPSFLRWLLWFHPLPRCPVQVFATPLFWVQSPNPCGCRSGSACPTTAKGDLHSCVALRGLQWGKMCTQMSVSLLWDLGCGFVPWAVNSLISSSYPAQHRSNSVPGLDGAGLCGQRWASRWRGSAAGTIAEVKLSQGRMSLLQEESISIKKCAVYAARQLNFLPTSSAASSPYPNPAAAQTQGIGAGAPRWMCRAGSDGWMGAWQEDGSGRES